jgi:RNA-directed DNA polymerase
LLCNVYLHRLDRAWATRGHGVLVRYADDLVVLCRTRREAERALGALKLILADLGLAPKWAKTRIVRLDEGGEGLDFLGFQHRWVRSRAANSRHVTFLARWPSRRAMQHARQRVREITARERLALPVEQIVRELNQFLRGWVGYFRYGNSTQAFDKIKRHAINRLAIFLARRRGLPPRYGWKMIVYESPDLMGLFDPGNVVSPRPNWGWRRETECRR